MKMARADLRMELRSAIREAIKERCQVWREGVRFKLNNEERHIRLRVMPLKGLFDEQRSLLIMFEESGLTSLPVAASLINKPVIEGVTLVDHQVDDNVQRIRTLEQELIATREYLQTIIEDRETANEELLSANEEIQSANEELQSSNEELETAKDELQSTNEELVTVNEELEGRNAELFELNNDLNNLLNGVQLPIIMLTESLNIRHFTSGATQLFNLIQSDVGRPISDIKGHL